MTLWWKVAVKKIRIFLSVQKHNCLPQLHASNTACVNKPLHYLQFIKSFIFLIQWILLLQCKCFSLNPNSAKQEVTQTKLLTYITQEWGWGSYQVPIYVLVNVELLHGTP